MKRIIILALIACCCLLKSWGQESNSTLEKPTQQTETVKSKKGDTVIISEWEDTPANTTEGATTIHPTPTNFNNSTFWGGMSKTANEWEIISILAVVLIFGTPIIAIFLTFFFRYKSKKARYKLIEKALESGQPLPENLFTETRKEDDKVRRTGINNVFVGLGMFILIWAITGRFSLGSVGIFIMCVGIGKLVIYYTGEPKKESKERKEPEE